MFLQVQQSKLLLYKVKPEPTVPLPKLGHSEAQERDSRGRRQGHEPSRQLHLHGDEVCQCQNVMHKTEEKSIYSSKS